jgi:hypothetical protein
VDELGAAVDACQSSIDVGHDSPPGAAGSAPIGLEDRGTWTLPGTASISGRLAAPPGGFGSLLPVWDAPAEAERSTRVRPGRVAAGFVRQGGTEASKIGPRKQI